MKTRCLSVRVPNELIYDLERAKEIVGATSYSDLIRDALRHYLAELSLLSARSEKIKSPNEVMRGIVAERR
ncbi:MAG: ribbon-helix-helix protein, CopG family [Nitrososphaeria archaeon]